MYVCIPHFLIYSIADEFSDLPVEHEHVNLLEWNNQQQQTHSNPNTLEQSRNTKYKERTMHYHQDSDGEEEEGYASDESCQETELCYDEESGYTQDGDLGRML